MTLIKQLNTLIFGMVLVSCTAIAAPSQDYWGFWDKSSQRNFSRIDHGDWNSILGTYVIDNHASGVNRFRYSAVTPAKKKTLVRYIGHLEDLDPRTYSRREQQAYWLNLYNALAVNLVLENYPIKSINDIDGGSALDSALVRVAGQSLSLNDIEHRILRPIWKDHKVHFGISCASISCPNLLAQAFTAANVNALLEKSGHDYINHPRGIYLKNGKMKASSMFNWYQDDFAKDDKTMLKVFAHYADDRLALYLLGFQGEIDYVYDWSLNAP
ncbi:MAG: DUF547 domain-containing protein [Porticoccus sp.]